MLDVVRGVEGEITKIRVVFVSEKYAGVGRGRDVDGSKRMCVLLLSAWGFSRGCGGGL